MPGPSSLVFSRSSCNTVTLDFQACWVSFAAYFFFSVIPLESNARMSNESEVIRKTRVIFGPEAEQDFGSGPKSSMVEFYHVYIFYLMKFTYNSEVSLTYGIY